MNPNTRKTIVIVDDDSHTQQTIRTLLHELCPNVKIVGGAVNVQEGIALINATHPDAVLLNISMEVGSGFDLLDRMPDHTYKVIFITAYDKFAIKAIRYNALDCLLKPIIPEELVAAIEKLNKPAQKSDNKQIPQLFDAHKKQSINRITLHTQDCLIFLNLDEIIRLEAKGSYTYFHLTDNRKHLISKPLNKFETLLPDELFYKIHQSHIVRTLCVRKVIKLDGGYAEMTDGSKIPIARRRKNEFLKSLE